MSRYHERFSVELEVDRSLEATTDARDADESRETLQPGMGWPENASALACACYPEFRQIKKDERSTKVTFW